MAKKPDNLGGLRTGMREALKILRTLPEIHALKERLAEQASHTRRLLRDNELLREQIAEGEEDNGLWKPPDVEPPCLHESFTTYRGKYGEKRTVCVDCGDEFEDAE